MVEKDNTDAPTLALLTGITGVLTIVTILAVIVLFYWKQERLEAEHQANFTVKQGSTLLQEQADSIPIEEGKKTLLEKGL